MVTKPDEFDIAVSLSIKLSQLRGLEKLFLKLITELTHQAAKEMLHKKVFNYPGVLVTNITFVALMKNVGIFFIISYLYWSYFNHKRGLLFGWHFVKFQLSLTRGSVPTNDTTNKNKLMGFFKAWF